MAIFDQDPLAPAPGQYLQTPTTTQPTCFVNVGTSPKHPFWCLLGTVVETSKSPPMDSYTIDVANVLEPQLFNLLSSCCERKLRVYVKLDDGTQPRFRNLLVDLSCGESGALLVLLYCYC